MDKMLEFTISGSYKTAQKDIIDFENVKGTVPFQDEDIATMHVRSRYVSRWIKEAKDKNGNPLYPERIQRVRECHIDDIKENTGTLSFVGKNIKELSFEELQDLALAKDLRRVPLYKASDLRNTRVMAYVNYVEKVLKGEPVEYQKEDFNFAKLPPIMLEGEARRDAEIRMTNEEIIDQEQKALAGSHIPESKLSLDDLKGIAKSKNIPFHPSIGYDTLYQKLYGAAA